MEFRILGPVELRDGDRSHPLGSPKERCVLAILLWELGNPVAVGKLVDWVWDENVPDQPTESVYSYVSRLRGRLRAASSDDGDRRLRRHSGYYTLEVDPETVDLHRFRRLRVQARAAADSGDDELAVSLLHEAERLWRGVPLAGLTNAWAERVRVSLEEERLAVVRLRIELELRLGHHNDLVSEISDLAAQHPYDEALIEHHMTALYRSGRQADALEAYRRIHRLYLDEQGRQPGLALRTLHERMLKEDPGLAGERSVRSVAQDLPTSISLPRDNPEFTGRAAELAKLFALLEPGIDRSAAIVVAITGMPGSGKSTLAIHTAYLLREQYSRQLYLDLHTHDQQQDPVDPAAGLGILLRSLGVPPDRIPATLEERAILWRTQLATRPTLIVLDDASDPDQIRPLLPGAGGCLVLITCRRRMVGLPGVFWSYLGPLPIDEAVTLFRRIAGRERVTEEADVASIVRLRGCLPLAIQLEANRFRNHPAWSVADLLTRLEASRHRLRMGHVEDREVAASFELSHQYLTSDQRRLFRRISLHPGAEFSVFAASAVMGGTSPVATEEALEVLLDYHLIEERELGRYAFHDLIREYARHHAVVDEEDAELRQAAGRMLDFYLHMAEQAVSAVFPFHRRLSTELVIAPDSLPSLTSTADYRRWVEVERTNLVSIVHYAARNNWVRHAGLLPHMLARFLDMWGYWEDAATLHRLAARVWHDAGDADDEASALIELCIILARTGQDAEALQCAQSALAIFRRTGNQVGEADALDRMGIVYGLSSRHSEALSCHDEALAIRVRLHDRHGEADALGHIGISLWNISRYGDALRYFNRALLLYRDTGDSRGEASVLNNMADTQRHLGFYEEALELYQQALTITRDIGERQGEAILLSNIGNVFLRTGRHGESVVYYRRALIVYRGIGDRRCEVDALNNIGAAYQVSGHYTQALVQHQKALVLARELAEPAKEVRSLSNMGSAQLGDSKFLSAANDYRAALELSALIGDPYEEGLAEDGLGSVLLRIEGSASARQHWQKALSLFEPIGVPEAATVRSRLLAIDAVSTGAVHIDKARGHCA